MASALSPILEKKYEILHKRIVSFKDRLFGEELNSQGLKILIVEDNRLNQILISEIIKLNGWDCCVAGNGMEAIEVLKKYKIDIILMDISMPIMDGIEATKFIKNNSAWKNIPIVALTAYDLGSQKSKFKDIGINDCLNKPINDEELYYMIIKHHNNLKKNVDDVGREYIEGIKKVENLLDGNKVLVLQLGEKILDMFSENSLDKIIEMINKGNFEEVMYQVHKMKGAIMNFHLNTIKSSLDELNCCIEQNNEIKCRMLINDIKLNVKKFEKALNVYSNINY